MTIPAPECISPFGQECGCPAHNGVCWPRPFAGCCDALEITPETPEEQVALIEQAMRLANEILHAMSGRQFGLCPVTVRPCRSGCTDGQARIVYDYAANGGLVQPALDGGQWFNNVCSSCVTDCSCTEVCEILLPGPVEAIVEVVQDGLVVDPLMYRVDNHRRLVRTSFGPLILTQWESLGGGAAVATQSDVPAHAVQIGGGVVVNPDGTLNLPAQPGPYALNFGLPNRVRQRIKLDLEPWAELTLPAGWTVELIEPLGAGSSVFQTGGEVRGGQFGGWVVITGAGQSPVLLLPDGPNNIGEERGGADIDYVSYVDDNRPGCWPTCQDMTAPLTDPNTLGVTYLIGVPVPEFGRFAAGLLACQLIAACSPNAEECCTLPANVQSIAREGVSMELSPIGVGADGITEFGRVGIPEVDMWLASVNPHKLQARSRAYSVDRRPPRSTTWPCND